MNNEQSANDLKNRLENLDAIADEPLPAGWMRRNWVQREALAFGAVIDDALQSGTPKKETP
jgi:hypothetical protein